MDSESVINSLYNAPQFASLKKEVLEIAGRKILVMEQCGLTDARRGRIEAEIKIDSVGLDYMEVPERLSLSKLYLDMASVSFGDVPKFIEFTAMYSSDYGIWLEKAAQINPVMFAWINEMAKAIDDVDAEIAKAEEDKKKPKPRKSRRRKSANG